MMSVSRSVGVGEREVESVGSEEEVGLRVEVEVVLGLEVVEEVVLGARAGVDGARATGSWDG